MGMDSDGCMTVAIVGGGASGVLSAVHLLRQENPKLRVVLIEPEEVGAGAAYVTNEPEHILNVVAARMSAYPDLPAHFLRWVNRITPTRPCDFVSRRLYRRYLQDVLTVAQAHLEPDSFTHHRASVTAIDVHENLATLRLDDGQQVTAHKVILALGNQTPRTPETETPHFIADEHYFNSPWTADLSLIGADDEILLIGAGLTTVDILLTLQKYGHRGQITAISRHGHWPLPHTDQAATCPTLTPPDERDVTSLLRWVREALAQAVKDEVPWQMVIDALRPHTNTLWGEMSLSERRRFSRHLAPLWNIARHRIPLTSAAVIEGMTGSGRLRLIAGKLRRVDNFNTTLTATITGKYGVTHRVQPRWILNCTGPNPDLRAATSPLFRQLFDDGLVSADALQMGLETALDGALVDATGKTSSVLYALGPLRRGGLFESSAVPEIREQAAALAQRLSHPLTTL